MYISLSFSSYFDMNELFEERQTKNPRPSSFSNKSFAVF